MTVNVDMNHRGSSACKPKKAKKNHNGYVPHPPTAFNTSCSKSPIPYDEERIIILEDAFYRRDVTLATAALYASPDGSR